MMIIYGGRGADSNALNDAWGLRKHRNGKWDWVIAPYRNSSDQPLPRYQHSIQFCGTTMIVIGGRTQHPNDKVLLEM